MIIRNDFFAVTDVILCCQRTAESGYHRHIKSRNSHGLTLVLSGELTFRFADKTITAKRGDIVLQQKNDAYFLENPGSPAEYVVISYLCEPASLVSEMTTDSKLFCCGHPERYADTFKKAAKVDFSMGLCAKSLLIAITQQLICEIIREKAKRKEPGPVSQVAVAKQFIEEHACMPITVQDVANHVGLSESYLRYLFKQDCGEPPVKYLNRVRVQRAKDLLTSDFFTLEEVAAACGFANVYYFSRVFKAYTGMSPGQY